MVIADYEARLRRERKTDLFRERKRAVPRSGTWKGRDMPGYYSEREKPLEGEEQLRGEIRALCRHLKIEIVECPECLGFGEISNYGPEECPQCHGDGSVVTS